jgi:hypothetical protein
MPEGLTDGRTHFEFGETWREYAKSVEKSRIEQAVLGLGKLFPEGLSS